MKLFCEIVLSRHLHGVGVPLQHPRLELLLKLLDPGLGLRPQGVRDDLVVEDGYPALGELEQRVVLLRVQQERQDDVVPQRRRFVVLDRLEQRVQLKKRILFKQERC